MAVTYLKRAAARPPSEGSDVRDTVAIMLANITRGAEGAVRDCAKRFDGWTGDIVLSGAARQEAHRHVGARLKET